MMTRTLSHRIRCCHGDRCRAYDVPQQIARYNRAASMLTPWSPPALPRLWTWRAPVRKVRLGLCGCDALSFVSTESCPLRQLGRPRHRVEVHVGQLCCVTAFV